MGTPPLKVTRSAWQSSSSAAGSRCGPGKTSPAPVSAAVKGSPQALAWNIGTTASTMSAARIAKLSAMAVAMEWSTSARCE